MPLVITVQLLMGKLGSELARMLYRAVGLAGKRELEVAVVADLLACDGHGHRLRFRLLDHLQERRSAGHRTCAAGHCDLISSNIAGRYCRDIERSGGLARKENAFKYH